MEPAYIYRAKLDRVIDGDTYRLVVDLGFYVSAAITVRLHAIDVYEKNTPEGQLATTYVEQLLSAKPIIVQSYKDQRSFERWVCDVWVGGEPLAALLRAAGFEKPQ